VAEIHQKQIAELQERRAQEDHTHVVEMHTLMQTALANPQQQLEELKQMIATMQGKEYVPQKAQAPVELRAMHPRGTTRFAKQDVRERMSAQLHRHATTDEIHKDNLSGL
jgi:hypothetical protein